MCVLNIVMDPSTDVWTLGTSFLSHYDIAFDSQWRHVKLSGNYKTQERQLKNLDFFNAYPNLPNNFVMTDEEYQEKV
eukprot:CAMPEP_0168608984 /NCGR_PEP_ID=MMETSP0449_2-20121227/947_1 /TAXON_ID=1082188 /ORGANISM="Strombidium rassoulzadegani, Strain ras09" /LENGTH=76 /DNA_ID=CAMNT_0008649063 /DNA_START=1063 /DNA_END=1293 /DNA_ORIENTATION=+